MSQEILLAHPPGEAEDYPRINLMPIGLFSISDYLMRCGLSAGIVHVGLERAHDPAFNLEDYLRTSGCQGSCPFCAGTKRAFRRFYRRSTLLWFDHEYVLDQLKKAAAQGIRYWNCCFDPEPQGGY